MLQVGRLLASCTGPSKRPIIAVTLFVGSKRLVGVTVRPIRRAALSAATMLRCAASGQSP